MARAMLRPQPASPMGLGFALDGDGRDARFGHSGDTFGFNARLTGFVETGQGAAVLTNSITGTPVIDDILRALAERYEWPVPGVPRRELDARMDVSALNVDGRYRLASGVEITVRGGVKTLELQVTGQDFVPLRAISTSTFVAEKLDVLVHLIGSPSGTITDLELEQSGESMRAIRVM